MEEAELRIIDVSLIGKESKNIGLPNPVKWRVLLLGTSYFVQDSYGILT